VASIFGLTQSDLQNASSIETVKAVFDDNNTGQLNTAAIAAVIERGEQEVLSWLVDEYGPAPFDTETLTELGADPFLKTCPLEYAVAHMFDRHPEYVRSGASDRRDRFKRADDRMKRVLQSRQRPTTVQRPPANVGGVAIDGASRLYVDSPDGTKNSGDY